jgi:hypothetical protein
MTQAAADVFSAFIFIDTCWTTRMALFGALAPTSAKEQARSPTAA